MSDGRSVSNVRSNSLARRIAITIGALLVFRLGSYIPLPGISPDAVKSLLQDRAAGAPGIFNIHRVTVFALGVVPYLSAAIFVQVLSMVWGRLSAFERSGEAGRRKIARYTLLVTLLLATLQAFGVASAIPNVSGLVTNPDQWFQLSAIASMVGGVFFLIWLSEQITRHGIGNGLALVLTADILAGLPNDFENVLQLVRLGAVSGNLALLHAVLWVAVVALVVFVESARLHVPVIFEQRKARERLLPARSCSLPIKINSAGYLIPVTMQSWAFFLPLIVAASVFGSATPWVAAAYNHTKFGGPAHLILGSIAVFVLAFIYTSYVLDPEHAAGRLSKLGGVIPGVAPGEPTADYLDRVASFATVVGAVYLVAVSLIPEALVAAGVALPYKSVVDRR